MGNQINRTNPLVYTINANGENIYSNVSNILKPLHYKKIWVGNCQTFALDYKNNLYSWGLNDYFQLGNNKNTKYIFNTNKKKKIYDTFLCLNKIFPIPGSKISKISTGEGFTLFLTKEGKVYSLGKNNKCQLGYEISYNQSEIINGIKCIKNPKEIEYFSKNNIFIIDIFSGSDFSFAKDNRGIFYSWGSNEHSQLARKNNNNKYEIYPSKADLIPQDITIDNLVCGWSHSILKTYLGEAYIWGNILYDYDKSKKDIEIPKKIDLIGKVIEISSGFHHLAIIVNFMKENNLYTFGVNDCGQLGYYTKKIYSEIPLKVEFPNKNSLIQNVSCGAFHTICKLNDNSVYGFGQNEHREVGLYQSDTINYPSIVNWINDNDNKEIDSIICGNGFTYILKINKNAKKNIKEKENTFQKDFSKINVDKISIKDSEHNID